MPTYASPATFRPQVRGTRFMASSAHHIATTAAMTILQNGGNAIDAGVAAGLCINVLEPDMTSLGGVAPIILYSARDDAVRVISGLGTWPQAASREYFVEECGGDIPPGVRRCVMPAAVDAWLTALMEFGTQSLATVAAPAISLAEHGFAMFEHLQHNIAEDAEALSRWPSTAAVFLPGGRVPRIGERFVQKDVARTLRMLVEAEESAAHAGREKAIEAARDRFYKGDIAEQIARFYQEEDGFLTLDDLASFHVDVEAPVGVNYRGYDVYSCGPWCQGPIVPASLAILNGYDVAAIPPQSVDYYHLIAEVLKAACADRHRYYGDPKFVEVPIRGLLNPAYGATWQARIRMDAAEPGMPEPGNPWPFQDAPAVPYTDNYTAPQPFHADVERDTSYVCVVDDQGNAFSATPSDGATGSPIVPGLGFLVSNRGKQSWLEADHPSAIAPGKRPRLTPSPGLVMRDGRVYAAYGCPGNDAQPQAMLQTLVNVIDYGMTPQAAIEAPRIISFSFPRSDHPHSYDPGLLMVEGRVADDVVAELERRGHQVTRWPDWEPLAAAVCMAVVDDEHGVISGGSDPRRPTQAIAW